MKFTLSVLTLILLIHLAACLRNKHKASTLTTETDQTSTLRKKFKAFLKEDNETSNEADPKPKATKTATSKSNKSTANNSTSSKKVDTSGAGPADVNAQLADATGIETNETSPPISRCTQSLGVDGFRIKDLYNFCVREPAHLKMNIWNVNIFEKKDASTLIASAEWTNIDFPVKNMTGAPECLYFQASAENDKKFAFCFEKEEDLDTWYDAIFTFKLCRDGIMPTKGKKKLHECWAEYG